MTHYHLVSVTDMSHTVANARIDKWEDALLKYVGMTNLLFGHLMPGDTDIEKAAASMDYGEGKGSMAGTHALSIALLTCSEDCEWASPTWN